MKNFFEINRALAAKKHFFHSFILSLFMSAIVLGMASCGDGNEPEVNDIQFAIQALSTKVRVSVTSSKKDVYFFSSWAAAETIKSHGGLEAFADEASKEQDFDDFISMSFILKDIDNYPIYNMTPDTKYIAYAFYVEKGEDNKPVRVSKIYSQEFKTPPVNILNGEFTVNADGKKVRFYSSNLGEKPESGGDYFSDDQWWYVFRNNTSVLHDFFKWPQITDPHKAAILAADEWWYLFRKRDRAEKLFSHAKVNGINGLILLPDNWQTPDGIVLTTSYDMGFRWDELEIAYRKDGLDGFAGNTFDKDQWATLEFAGAVFLPAPENSESIANARGWYWSSTEKNDYFAHAFYFMKDKINLMCLNVSSVQISSSYCSIRLVQEVK